VAVEVVEVVMLPVRATLVVLALCRVAGVEVEVVGLILAVLAVLVALGSLFL
jgi:hypothetical protein